MQIRECILFSRLLLGILQGQIHKITFFKNQMHSFARPMIRLCHTSGVEVNTCSSSSSFNQRGRQQNVKQFPSVLPKCQTTCVSVCAGGQWEVEETQPVLSSGPVLRVRPKPLDSETVIMHETRTLNCGQFWLLLFQTFEENTGE